MVQQNCAACNTALMGEPGSRVVCPKCGRSNTIALLAPPGAGTFQPTPIPQPLQPMAPMGPRRTHPPAIIALVAGISSFLLGGLGSATNGASGGPFEFVGALPLVGLGLAITAIVLGIVSIREINRRPNELQGKGMAIAGLVLGIVFASLIVLAFVMVLIFALLCAAACGRAGGAQFVPAGIPLFGIQLGARVRREFEIARRALREDAWGALFLHHPRCAAFREDAVSTPGGPVCASCLALFAGAGICALIFRAIGPEPSLALFAAALVAALLLHVASVLGFTTPRSLKLTARGMQGAALIVLGASLPALGANAWIVFAAILVAGFAFVWIRAHSLRIRFDAHPHDAACAVTP